MKQLWVSDLMFDHVVDGVAECDCCRKRSNRIGYYIYIKTDVKNRRYTACKLWCAPCGNKIVKKFYE